MVKHRSLSFTKKTMAFNKRLMSSSDARVIFEAHAVAVTNVSGYVLVDANMSDMFKLR